MRKHESQMILNLDGLLNANDRRRLRKMCPPPLPKEIDSPELTALFTESDNRHEHNDCTVKALAAVAEISYNEAHNILEIAGRCNRRGFKMFSWLKRQYTAFGVDLRFGKYKAVPVRFYDWPTLAQVKRDFPRGRFLARQRGHAFAIIDGKAFNANGGNRVRVQKLWYFEREKAA